MNPEELPAQCDPEIFGRGDLIVQIDGSSRAVERWVRAVAERAAARVDWHLVGGIANVLHLGDLDGRRRVISAVKDLKGDLDGEIIRYYDEPGYRPLRFT